MSFVNTIDKKLQSLKIGIKISCAYKCCFLTVLSLLACESFNTSHTGIAIAEKLHSILQKNGIRGKTR